MKVKHKLLVIALLLSIVFTMSAVAAAENATFEQSDIIEEVSDETLSAPSDEVQEMKSVEEESSVNVAEDDKEILQASEKDQLTESNFGTFSEIQTKINNAKSGDTIYLNGKTYISDNKRTI